MRPIVVPHEEEASEEAMLQGQEKQNNATLNLPVPAHQLLLHGVVLLELLRLV